MCRYGWKPGSPACGPARAASRPRSPVRTDDILLEAYHSIITQNVAVKDAMQQAYDKYTKLLGEVPKDKLPQA